MNPSTSMQGKIERDRQVWNRCADTYEERVVRGHPDVLAYEEFEEDFLDRVLLFLAREQRRKFVLFDVGCGSGRLHLRYGMKTANTAQFSEDDAFRISFHRGCRSDFAFDPLLAEQLVSIAGVDFSREMLALARNKLHGAGLGTMLGARLLLDRGSAFELRSMPSAPLPVVVCVCNSIGVMQGPDGAAELFDAIKRAVGDAGGIGIISAYRRDAVGTFGLGNYESTMDVGGQPRWLSPGTYASSTYKQIPRDYKRAYDPSRTLEVDVFDNSGKLVMLSHQLVRNEEAVRSTLESGHIQTYSDYESYWYSFEQFETWISARWSGYETIHVAGGDVDALRGAPAQLAILDPQQLLNGLFERLLRSGFARR